MTNDPHPRPTPGVLHVPCECGAVLSVGVIPGQNDIYKPCACGAVIHIVCVYDGYGAATISTVTIEKVVSDD